MTRSTTPNDVRHVSSGTAACNVLRPFVTGNVRNMHPRPQLTRENWQDLSGTWGFAHDDGDVGVLERWWERGFDGFDREITVPFPPESRASGVHDPAPHPIVWYRREFTAPAGDRVILHFGAVDYRATVWVNG